MKKPLIILFTILCTIALLGGCASPALSTASAPSSSSSQNPSNPTPTDTAPASASPKEDQGGSNNITHEGWTYYLDENDGAVVNYGEDAPLHMKKSDGTGDQDLHIRGFNLDIIGDYIYIDSHDPDLGAKGEKTWSTTRLNLDGTGRKELEYGSMSVRYIPEGKQEFYFTTTGDSAIYVSDFSCENVTVLMVDLPDKSELDNKLGADKVLQLDINGVEDGWIDFDATFATKDGTALYNGTYKITGDGTSIKKVKGEYITSGALENE